MIHPSRRSNFKNTYTHPPDSILNSQVQEAVRPYSQNELCDMETTLYDQLFIAPDMLVHHEECGHTYHVKKNGVRFKEIKALNITDDTIPDVGNCSVCWKYYKTPHDIRFLVDEFIDLYNECPTTHKTYFDYQVKRIFYTWLYQENY